MIITYQNNLCYAVMSINLICRRTVLC
ncbi:hypothetical protein CT19431_MP30420 [Cupriavidus taiwanensis]|nr:hypothetical protein CT19431_MP30420 [Cupriavidus taiwanensis]